MLIPLEVPSGCGSAATAEPAWGLVNAAAAGMGLATGNAFTGGLLAAALRAGGALYKFGGNPPIEGSIVMSPKFVCAPYR